MATFYTKEYEEAPAFGSFNSGQKIAKFYGTADKTATVADGDYMILAQKLVLDNTITAIKLTTTGITGMADVDIVILKPDGTELKNSASTPASITLMEGRDLEGAYENINLLGVGITDFDKSKSIKGLTGRGGDNNPAYVDIALKVNTAGTGLGTISVEIEYSAPQ